MSAHVHRCMRCGQEFACRNPGECQAGYMVIPSIITRDARGAPVVVQHCPPPTNDRDN